MAWSERSLSARPVFGHPSGSCGCVSSYCEQLPALCFFKVGQVIFMLFLAAIAVGASFSAGL